MYICLENRSTLNMEYKSEADLDCSTNISKRYESNLSENAAKIQGILADAKPPVSEDMESKIEPLIITNTETQLVDDPTHMHDNLYLSV